jgi:glycine oxidase
MHDSTPHVAVIGAGIIGASIGWRLAQAGCKVTLVDAGSMGGEASWAGAGMLAPGGEIESRSAWGDFAMESLGLYRGFVEELQSEGGRTVDFQQRGAVEVAFTADEWERLRARAAAQSAIGIASERLDAAALRKLIPILDGEFAGTLYFPADALVDPRDVMSALRCACTNRGVQIHENRHAAAVRWLGSSVEIDTEAGMLTADRAVIAAGAWSGEIAVWREQESIAIPASFPVKGHLLGYRLEAGSLGPILRHASTYLVQRSNGFTIAGSSAERVGFDRGIHDEVVADIHQRACSLLPCLSKAAPPEPWTGFRPATDSLEPEIRRLPGTGLWLSYGHYRNGILLAPATAQRLTREIISS